MSNNDIQNAKDILSLTEIFKKENKEELLMLVKAADKLDSVRSELETKKHEYQKSLFSILEKNFRACLVFLSLVLLLLGAIYIPAQFKIEIGAFKIEKSQSCSTNSNNN